LQITQALCDPGEIAFAITVRILKVGGVYAVEDGTTPPRFNRNAGACPAGARQRLRARSRTQR